MDHSGKITNSLSIFPYQIRRSAEIESVNFNPSPSAAGCTNMYANHDKLVCCAYFFGVEWLFFGNFCKKNTEGTTRKSYSQTLKIPLIV